MKYMSVTNSATIITEITNEKPDKDGLIHLKQILIVDVKLTPDQLKTVKQGMKVS